MADGDPETVVTSAGDRWAGEEGAVLSPSAAIAC
ncbi:hypothetical protein BLJAPNOD_00060 [Ensifer sp. M14]|nr:hypothetical protein BLJAPNOD_00060 [Ensifer sp. M14]